MSIFINYKESRKKLLNNLDIAIYHKYGNIHQIEFPPTHPKYKHIFSQSWQVKTRSKIVDELTAIVNRFRIHDSNASIT